MLDLYNTVYWGITSDKLLTNNFLSAIEPQKIHVHLKKFSNENVRSNFLRCPATNSFIKNRYTILSPIDYELRLQSNEVISPNYGQEEFDKWVEIRDIKNKIFSVNFYQYIFFTEQSCEMTINSTLFNSSELSSKIDVVPGTVDIGSWFRPVDFCFVIKEPYNNIILKKDERLFDVNFNFKNKKPIRLKKFYMCNELKEFCQIVLDSKRFIVHKNLQNYFDKFYYIFNQSKLKTNIIKKIKENMME